MNKNYCDICEKEVTAKIVKFENNVQICKKHLNKLGYFKEAKE